MTLSALFYQMTQTSSTVPLTRNLLPWRRQKLLSPYGIIVCVDRLDAGTGADGTSGLSCR